MCIRDRIKESTGLVLGFATTNQHGAYSICDIADKEGAKIVVTGLGIKERVVPIKDGIWHYDIDCLLYTSILFTTITSVVLTT